MRSAFEAFRNNNLNFAKLLIGERLQYATSSSAENGERDLFRAHALQTLVTSFVADECKDGCRKVERSKEHYFDRNLLTSDLFADLRGDFR